MYWIGIDVSEHAVKVAIFKNYLLTQTFILEIEPNILNLSEKLKKCFKQKEIDIKKYKIISTGRGANNISFADKNLTEISCKCRGAKYIYDEDDLVVVDESEGIFDFIEIKSGIINSIYLAIESGKDIKRICKKLNAKKYFLVGRGCCDEKVKKKLSKEIGTDLGSDPLGRYSVAIGAALLAQKIVTLS